MPDLCLTPRWLAHQFDTSVNSRGLGLSLITAPHYRSVLKPQLTARSLSFAIRFYPVFHKVNALLSAVTGTGRASNPNRQIPPHQIACKGFRLLPHPDLCRSPIMNRMLCCSRSSSSPDDGSPNEQEKDPNPAGGKGVQSERPSNLTKWITSLWGTRFWKTRPRVDEPHTPPKCYGDKSASKVAPMMQSLSYQELHSPGDGQRMGKASAFTLEICKRNLKIHPIQEAACL